ncbi:isochorismatase family protein [Thiohalocapsa marina]|uniref:Isochorismatase family protein n=1 Tax=Thiohalocapsa marina TaxID=424902 RepID=A0A5M8FI61_9GAMM|nr:isochorismatase family protein [Thiohalocapsa marina]KAA6184369.1 isochorismatase family protein [Thiohalocapsa marina]
MSTHPAPMPLCQGGLSQLLIIDAQERLAAAMPTDELATAVGNMKRLLNAAKILDIPVISTEQYPQGLGKTLADIRDELPENATPTEKTSFSCCTAAGFERALTSQPARKQVVLVGMEAHICIVQTASGLQRWGYQVFVPADAICSRDPANRLNVLDRMRHCGIQVTNTESVAFEWIGDSTNDRFREVSRLFK